MRECWDTGTRISTWCAPGGGGEGACLNDKLSSLLCLNDAECDVFNVDDALIESIAAMSLADGDSNVVVLKEDNGVIVLGGSGRRRRRRGNDGGGR